MVNVGYKEFGSRDGRCDRAISTPLIRPLVDPEIKYARQAIGNEIEIAVAVNIDLGGDAFTCRE